MVVATMVVGETDDGQFIVAICTHCDTSYRIPISDPDDVGRAIVTHCYYEHGCAVVALKPFDTDVQEFVTCIETHSPGSPEPSDTQTGETQQ